MKILLFALAKPLLAGFVAAGFLFGYNVELREADRADLELHLLEEEAKDRAKLGLPEAEPAPQKKDAPPAPPADPSAP